MVRRRSADPPAGSILINEVRSLSRPLHESADLDPLMTRIGEARVVLLGEASHGTNEFYTWRTAITKRLIEESGFDFVAVEGDWPDCYRVNRYVKGFGRSQESNTAEVAQKANEVLNAYQRWPTWMWGNWEVAGFIDWLRSHNTRSKKKVGFYGLDVYSLWEFHGCVTRVSRKTRSRSSKNH